MSGQKRGPKEGLDEEDEEDLPEPIRAELRRIPRHLVGVSAFAFARVVRLIARQGIDVVEVDLVNSVYQLLQHEFPTETPECVSQYLQHREDLLAKVGKELKAPRRECKQLLISIIFGGSFASWCSRTGRDLARKGINGGLDEVIIFLEELEDGVVQLHRAACWRRLTPEQKQWHLKEKRSLASACFSYHAHLERLVLDILRRAAGEDLVCPAHDGVDVLRSSASKVVEAVAPLQLAVKEPEDPWVFANAEYPGYDWTLRAQTPWLEFCRVGRHMPLQGARHGA